MFTNHLRFDQAYNHLRGSKLQETPLTIFHSLGKLPFPKSASKSWRNERPIDIAPYQEEPWERNKRLNDTVIIVKCIAMELLEKGGSRIPSMMDLSYQDGERTLIVENLVKAVAGSGGSYGPYIMQTLFRHQGKRRAYKPPRRWSRQQQEIEERGIVS